MSNFKDMPLDTTLQKGDVVTITGPGEHDVLVREVTGVRADGEPDITGHVYPHAALSYFITGGRTLTRVQRPVPALPTVEGDYILTTLTNGYRCVLSLRDGAWLNGLSELDDVQWLTARVKEGATLTRVIPADEVKHPEVDVEAAVEAFQCSPEGTYEKDFETTLRRALEGEFDL